MIKIGVVAQKGGVGKSTLAVIIKQANDNAQIVDMDAQKTITRISNAVGEPVSVKEGEATAKYIIYDTPPFRDIRVRSLLKSFDYIVIPTKIGDNDLFSLVPIYKDLLDTKTISKAIVVFNDVRKPLSNTSKEIIKMFFEEYPKLKFAKTMLSSLDVYKTIISKPLTKERQLKSEEKARLKALKQVKTFLKEILK